NVSVTATDATSGINNVTFPATTSAGGTDTASAYSWTYDWDTSDTYSQNATIQAYDNAQNNGTCEFNITKDITAPSGGSVNYNNTFTELTAHRINVSDGTDSGSGLSTAQLYRQSATLTGGTCGSYGSFSAVGNSSTGKTSVDDSGLSTGNCYKYLFNVTDNVGNTVNYTSSNEIKVDSGVPTCTVNSITENSTYGYVSGKTLYYSNKSTGGYNISASATDSGSGIKNVTFPATTSTGGNDSLTPYNWTYDWDTLDSYSQNATIQAYSNSLKNGTCEFNITLDITAPAGGSVSYNNTNTSQTAHRINVSEGTDSGSGLSTAQLYRQSATLTGTTCGAYGAWSAIGNSSTEKTSVDDATLSNGNCYKYAYNATDNVQNIVSYTSANEIKVDTTGPTITFIPPTSANNSNISNPYTYINISGSETLISANIEWNGTNQSMNGAGTNWYTNKTSLSDGIYSYRVFANDSANNIGFSGLMTITIDTTAPTCSVSAIAENTTYGYVSGKTLYYNTAAGGGYNVSVTATDATSGIKNVSFPITTSSGGADLTSAYSWTYDWDTSDTYSQNATIQAYDNAQNNRSCEFNITRDITAPSGGYVSYNNTISSKLAHRINVSDGTDSGSGLAAAQLYSQSATLTGTTCGSYGNFTAVGNSATGKTYVDDSTLLNGYCYKYLFNVTDNVQNTVNYTSANEIKIDSGAPTINFVYPSDDDNANVTRTYTYVNVTASETLTSAKLEWNGSEQAMSGSGTNWYINKTSLSEGIYSYRVSGNDSSDNWGYSATRTITIDTTAPTCSVSAIAENTTYGYVSGKTLYYSNKSTGGYNVSVTATDATSGIKEVAFSSTTSIGGTDATSAYSWTYDWNTSAIYSQNATITAYDNVLKTATCEFTVTKDITAPSGGSVSYNNTNTSKTAHRINVSEGTDSGSGLATAQLYRQSATLTGTTCGSYGAFTAIGTSATGKTSVDDSGLSSGNCYKYLYNVTDNVQNTVNYTSANEIKVDISPPGITFVYPTDANNSNVTRTYTFINITGNETLISANLEWNGTNQSMSGSGTNWYINKTSISDGIYSYKVFGNDSSDNIGVSEIRSITIDVTSPTCSVSAIAENSTYGYVSGITLYYSNKSTGGYNVSVTATDATSGVKNVTFPTTTSAGGNDSLTAYSWTYDWDTSDTYSQNATIQAYDNSQNNGTCEFNITKDITSPSGGSVNYNDTFTALTVHRINVSEGTDSGSGLSTAQLYRQSATLTGGTCGSYGSFSAVGNSSTGKTYQNDSNLVSGNCYKYAYNVTDNVQNIGSYTSANEIKVDSGVPTCTVNSITENSTYGYVSGKTLYYSNKSTGGYNISASATDSGSGIKNVTFPATTSAGGNDSLTPYNWTYDWDTSDTYSQNATIQAYSNSLNNVTCEFNITKDITAPSGGSISYNNTNTSQTAHRINVSDGTDSGSGLATAQLYRQEATLTDITCGSYGAFTTIGNSSTGKTYVYDATLVSGNCYKYLFNVTDNVQNTVNYTSANEIRVDSGVPEINFVYPTDNNNANISRLYTYINITSTKSLSSANLEWNGTNESMSGSGTNWYKNKTSLPQGVYTYTVFGTDPSSNTGFSETRTITINTLNIDSYELNATIISPNEHVRLNASASCEGCTIDSLWATLRYPNGTTTNYTLSKLYSAQSNLSTDQEAGIQRFNTSSVDVNHTYNWTSADLEGSIEQFNTSSTATNNTYNWTSSDREAGTQTFNTSASGSTSAWTLIGGKNGTVVANANNQINLPAGMQEGDIVLIAVACDNSLATTGLVPLQGYTNIVNTTNASPGRQIAYKVMGASVDSTVNITAGTLNSTYVIQGWRGVDTSVIYDVATPAEATGITLDPNAPAITPTTNGSLIVIFGEQDDDGTTLTSHPSGFSNGAFNSTAPALTANQASVMMASMVWPSTNGTVDPATWAISGTDEWKATSIALRPNTGYTASAEQNSTLFNYSDDGTASYQTATKANAIVTIDSYNPEASNTTYANNSRPDIQVAFYNGTAYESYSNCNVNASVGNEGLNTTDWNCTISSATTGVLNSWNSSANRKVQIRAINLDAYDNLIFDEINVSAVYINVSGYNITTANAEQNSTATEYSNGGSDYQAATAVKAIVTIDSYNPTASNTTYANNNRPDIQVAFYNGTAYGAYSNCNVNASMGNNGLNTTDWNCTISATDDATIAAWNSNTNRKIQIRGINLDAYNSLIYDEINVSAVYLNISGYNITSNVSEQNTEWVEYAGIGGINYTIVTSVSAIITVDSYNPTASNTTYANNNRPDLEVGFWNGTGYVNSSYCTISNSMGNDGLNTIDWNCTVTSTNSEILNAWEDSAKRKIQMRGINLDAYNRTIYDEINVTSLFAQISYGSATTDVWYFDFNNTAQLGNYTIPSIYINSTIGMTKRNDTTLQFEVTGGYMNITLVPPTPDNQSWVNESWVFVNATTNIAASACNLTWNATNYAMGSYDSNTWYKNMTSVASGQYVFNVSCISPDNIFNVSKTSIVNVNSELPSCSINSISENSDYSYVSGTIVYYNPSGNGSINATVNAVNSFVGIAKVEFKPVSTFSGYGNDTISIYASQDVGAYNFSASSSFNGQASIVCHDNSNKTNTTTFNLSLDNVIPTLTINTPAALSWQKSNFTINVSDSDSESGLKLCQYRVVSNGSETRNWTARACNNESSATISVGTAQDCRNEGTGQCFVDIRTWDNVNNSNTKNRTFSIDWTAPGAPGNLTDSIEGWSFSSNRTFTWTASVDNGSGISTYYFAIDNTAPESAGRNSSDLNYTNQTLSSGNYTLYVLAVDKAGNVGAYSSHEFLILSSKGIISTTPGATPFWTNTSNPLLHQNTSCLWNMQSGEECNVTWDVNSTGAIGGRYQFYVIFESLNYTAQVPDNNTNITNIEIRSNNTAPPKVNLSSPANNSGIVHELNTTFAWQNVTDEDGDLVSYYIEVSSSSAFGSKIIDNWTTELNYTSTIELNISNSYYWRVRAFDGFDYGNYSDIWNFSIEPYREVDLYISNTSFGGLSMGETNDTTDDIPSPLKIRNTGNIMVNVSINATNLWTSVGNGTANYRFKADNVTTEVGSFDWVNSQTSWYNLNTGLISAIRNLNYSDTMDEAEIDVYVLVPITESPGLKNSTITVKAS
ncbi:MAG: hypothetical protein NTV63_02350, partial [Candidatus Woesearchaeota archaeon]|nr:hypothetical protein [Candidatus Woesearchaeota archaeon]